MKIFKCKICSGEIDIMDIESHTTDKVVKCRRCGFTNSGNKPEVKEPEIFIIRKKKCQ